MYFGSSCRIYKNGLILVGSEVWDLINSLQTSKLIKNLSSCGQKTRKLRFGPIDGHYSLPTVVGRMKRSCFLHILKWWGLGGWMWIGLCEVLGGGETQTTAAGQQAIHPRLFTSSLASTPVSCLSNGIAQLIMTRKIIAAHMMKTLDPRPKGDLHPTWVLYFLCGLRKVWKETDLCGLYSGWEWGAVVTTQSVPYGRDWKGWAAWGGSVCEGLSHQIGTGLQQISHAKYPSKLKHVYFFFLNQYSSYSNPKELDFVQVFSDPRVTTAFIVDSINNSQ